MARPRKNAAPKVEEKLPEFQYDNSDELYQQLMTNGTILEPRIQEYKEQEINHPIPEVTYASVPIQNLIFFVEGKIRLDQEGASAIFSDQRRIVNASNVDDAINKFVKYFVNMSNPSQRYTIVEVVASETIL